MNDKIKETAKRLVSAIDSFEDISSVTQFTINVDGSRYRFFKNRVKTASFPGWYEVINTNEPEHADCVCTEANKLIREDGRKLGTNLNKLTEEMRNAEQEQKVNPKSSQARKKNIKDSAPEPELFFSPPKSTAEDLFNTMLSEYSSGMNKPIRLYTGYGYLVFDSISVIQESASEDERMLYATERLNSWWNEHKPVKQVFTQFEVFRELGIPMRD